MGKIFKIIYIFLAIVFLISWWQVGKMPDVEKISSTLLQEPIQSADTERKDFDFFYRQQWYKVQPLADYELWGLVVSKNNINTWYNYYHNEDSVNFKDICVVWGDNVKTGAYRQKNIKFSSGEWTCYYQWSGRLDQPFHPYKLSNNHLLADNQAVQKVIRQLNIGDQIHLKGALIDYSQKGYDWKRQTSLSREDDNKNARGGGACEIMFVDQADVIKHNQLFWNYLYNWKWKIIISILVLNILWFLGSIFHDTHGH